jgi:hypothetical protein
MSGVVKETGLPLRLDIRRRVVGHTRAHQPALSGGYTLSVRCQHEH